MKWILSLLTACTFIFSCTPERNDPLPPLQRIDSLGGWQKITTSLGSAADIVFVSPAKGYIANSSGLFQSLDSGKTWNHITNVGNGSIATINFMNAQNGYFVGSRYGFTTNSGNTWTTLNANGSGIDVYFTNTSTGYLAGFDGIYRTSDTGRTWARTLTDATYSIYFPDAANGWAGGVGKIFKTVNAGVNWTPNLTGGFGPVYAIYFSNQNNGWFVGNADSAVYKTTNGGANWQRSGIKGSPFDLHFIDNNIGYVVPNKEAF